MTGVQDQARAEQRRDRAERVSEAIRRLLLRAAEDGTATGSVTINLKDGFASGPEIRLVTGERDGFRFPNLA